MPSSAEMQAPPPRSSHNLKEEKREGGPGLLLLSLGAPAQADFLSRKSCAPWHALSARPGPGACLPRCCPSRRPIRAATWGPRHASPVLPPRGTAGFRTKGWGRGRGASVCLLSPRGLRPSNSRFLKEPRPVRRALSGSRLAVPDRFPILSLLGTCPESLLVP